jgi:hypothetical protein
MISVEVLIRARMVICPNVLRSLPVSMTTRPVTRVAELEVNSAFINPRLPVVVTVEEHY